MCYPAGEDGRPEARVHAADGSQLPLRVLPAGSADSIWPADRPIPAGWRPEGFAGTREACLGHVDAVWTDMRPRSVREAMSTRSDAAAP